MNASSLLHGGLLVLLSLTYFGLVYVTVATLGALLFDDLRGSGVPWWLSALGLAVIALTTWPVVRWLHRQTADLIYGQHDDPYTVISEVNEVLQVMVHPGLTLPEVAQTIATRLNLPYVALQINEPAIVFEYGRRPERSIESRIAIAYLGRPLGVLTASGRGSGQHVSAGDLDLLGELARQVATALHASQLTAELQNARERLVIAREEERRRIRNDLHDGLAPTLSSLQLQLGGLRNLITHDPARAEAIADDLKVDMRLATSAIRQLVYDLRPPMLDELGLVAALKVLCPASSGIRCDVEAPGQMPPVSAAVEVALYRIASEAIHNVVKHSGATECVTLLEADHSYITLTVTDNGRPPGPGPERLPDQRTAGSTSDARAAAYLAGIGLVSMRERAAELGGTCTIERDESGGTRVVARLPLGANGMEK